MSPPTSPELKTTTMAQIQDINTYSESQYLGRLLKPSISIFVTSFFALNALFYEDTATRVKRASVLASSLSFGKGLIFIIPRSEILVASKSYTRIYQATEYSPQSASPEELAEGQLLGVLILKVAALGVV
ncbi:hypothetical protein BJ138DRAFT_1120780 [Hygrophoropsis aurantiaca]|uniref:Uncharacterized protein n=1 Tax=Hygrophoropsis aurantiaca TaxID=72124 RepID=A0ACB7ZQW2_9AGAM|nr:hypothetical protein BJ138DRAFT_1120780 [Hygrophoropsis aurantiaca]